MNSETKRSFLEECLNIGVVAIHVDAHAPGVVIPVDIANKHGNSTQLNLSWRYGAKLMLTDEHIEATLSFNQRPFDCIIPWESIWGISQGDQLRAFSLNMPPEVARKLNEAQKVHTDKLAEEKRLSDEKAAKRAKFRVVSNDD